LGVPDEDYSRNTSCALNFDIYAFIKIAINTVVINYSCEID